MIFAAQTSSVSTRRRWLILTILATLAIVPYLPTLSQPFIEDDYPNIQLANGFAAQGWSEMLANPIFRLRATTHLLFHGLYQVFDMDARAYYAAMILLHVMNTCLVFALGSWPVIGYGVSLWAAAFFAIYEGHQEAVMWISGSTEPLLVLFGLLSFLCWVQFLARRSVLWYAGSFLAFCLSLASKESAVIWVALLALAVAFEPKKWREVFWLLPHATLSANRGMVHFPNAHILVSLQRWQLFIARAVLDHMASQLRTFVLVLGIGERRRDPRLETSERTAHPDGRHSRGLGWH